MTGYPAEPAVLPAASPTECGAGAACHSGPRRGESADRNYNFTANTYVHSSKQAQLQMAESFADRLPSLGPAVTVEESSVR